MNKGNKLCKICKSKVTPIFKAKIMNKYYIQYYQCPNCFFIQTEKEYWLSEAYESPINISDTSILSRNIYLGLRTSLLINFLLGRKGRFLDYAGGYGVLTRFMRDIGFNFLWHDPYTKNNFARGFEGDIKKEYDAITLFEGLEHFTEPLKDFNKIFKVSNTIIFSTTLLPKSTPKPKDWWYYGLEHGQHIAFYSRETLNYIAKKYSFHYYTDGKYYHMFSRKRFSKILFISLTSYLGLLLLPIVIIMNKSKTLSDNKRIANEK